MRGIGPRTLAALLVVGVMLLASIGPLAQLAKAQQGEASASANVTVTSNITNTSAGYGIIVALNMSVENVAALFNMWSVPSNSSLWTKLQEINNTIPEIENLVKQGKLDEARQEAAKLFRELGLLVAEAAKLYASHVARINVTATKLLARINKLAALERAVMASLVFTLHHLEASLHWTERSGAVCDNVTEKLREMIAKVNQTIALDKQLLNETLGLRQAILVGNMSLDKALNETKALEARVKEFVRNASSLVTQARIAIAEPHACKAMQTLHRMMAMLEKKIANLTNEAKKLRQEGRIRAAQILERQAAILKQILEHYEQVINKTKAELPRLHGLGDIIEIIKIRHMMPRLITPIFKKFHIIPIPMIPIKSIDKEILALKMVALELRAAKNLVPSNLSAQYNYALGNLTKLVSILEDYRAGKASQEEVIKAANETLTALEEFKEALKQYREQLQGQQAQSSTSTTTQSQTMSNTTATNAMTNTTTHTSTTTPSNTTTTPSHTETSTTTPAHTETTTPRAKGGRHGDAGVGLAERGGDRDDHNRASNITSTTTKSSNPMKSIRNSVELRKIDILLHLVDKAESIVKKILVSLGQAHVQKPSKEEAKHLARGIIVAERIVGAATRLAKLEGNQTMIKQLESVEEMLKEAEKSLASGNISVAKTYLENALNTTKQVLSNIVPSDWIAMKTRMFLERVIAIIEMIITSIVSLSS